MNLNQVKETLEAIGYPVKGPDWDDVLADLHCNYGAQKVGSSINSLGDAAPLYIRSGNIAFMVDNRGDLHRACVQIKAKLDEKKGAQPVVLKQDEYAFNLTTIRDALEREISHASNRKRPLGIVDTDYTVQYNPDTRTQNRKSLQIINDLLSDDKQRNNKAVEAIKAILIIK
ncbi:hypothetical protein [uncultured Amphritea sp.]|uniref:hypothetical protein n=1 Tax=uncultured Amphritea sp. TaxID=981605 RepID=UPI0025F17104|nr:hypothetical protein [uncultured Amphritea sp.]